jgi:hypothetical protein
MEQISKDMIGRQGEPATRKIEAGDVRRFSEAIGIPYTEKVPPTFVITLRGGDFPGLDFSLAGVIHGKQEFTYYQPVFIGDILTCTQRIKDVYQRKGNLGEMTFVILETVGHNLAGELVFASCSTLISSEKGDEHEEVS